MGLGRLRGLLQSICCYKPLMQLPVMVHITHLLDALERKQGEAALDAYTAVFYALREDGYNSLSDWLFDSLRFHESPYATMLEQDRHDPALETVARRDVETFIQLASTSCDRFTSAIQPLLSDDYVMIPPTLPHWGTLTTFSFEDLVAFYQASGAGLFARYRAFVWEQGALLGVADPDCPYPDDLRGYELQRQQVIANTRALVQGHPVNNVLLFGDGGTGKSATVKSLLHMDGMADLRLIEVNKSDLADLTKLIRTLGGHKQKFILFIDDLAFDQDDNTYSALKTILEGGLERRPQNVAIYATSNRRHLVRQTFSDRAGDEVDTFETIAEKTALAERFGIRIPYLSMSKAEYLTLVDHLAQQENIAMEPDELHAQAMRWEIRHAGRTPRTARQFIASLHVSKK